MEFQDQVALPRSPKVQATMFPSCESVAMYCMKESPAANMALMATPASIMVSALTRVTLVRRRMEPVASRENRKAHSVVT
jgi:hypothetical protein